MPANVTLKSGCETKFTGWVVYAKPPFGGPEHVLHYLARYTHRVAISNHRLVAFQNDRVSFRWKDYAHGGKQKIMTVSADEFLRRFLIHILPKGLVRIRHFGLFANRKRGDALARCRIQLGGATCASNLGGHFKTGHAWTSQNRPR